MTFPQEWVPFPEEWQVKWVPFDVLAGNIGSLIALAVILVLCANWFDGRHRS